jgi:hypothetical protein
MKAEYALNLLNLQGGYIELQEPYFSGSINTSYLIYDNKSRLPSLKDIERQISAFLKQELPICLKNTSIEYSRPEIEVRLTDESYIIEVDWELKQDIGDQEKRMSKFYINNKNGFLSVYDNAKEIIRQHIDMGLVDILSILEMENEVQVFAEDDIIYMIIDNSTRIDNHGLVFVFAADR